MVQPCWTNVLKAILVYIMLLGYEIIPITAGLTPQSCTGCQGDWTLQRCRDYIIKCSSSAMGKRSQHPLHRVLSADIHDKVEMDIETGEWDDNQSSTSDQDTNKLDFIFQRHLRNKLLKRVKNRRRGRLHYIPQGIYFR